MIPIISNVRAHVYRQTSLNPTKAFKHDNINYFSDQCAFTELQNDEPDICPLQYGLLRNNNYIFTSIIIIIQYKTREITGGPKNLLTFCISSAAWRKAPSIWLELVNQRVQGKLMCCVVTKFKYSFIYQLFQEVTAIITMCSVTLFFECFPLLSN